jgi:creatinine amidohydrolase
MLWENLTVKQFEQAVKDTGVCVLPIGVLEKHGNHLPLGTDMFSSRAVCEAAAKKEKAIVFPYYFMGQIAEAIHFPGTVSVPHKLLMENLLAMCDEIARNGLKKILIMSGHGGNSHVLPFFAQEFPRLNRDYCVYTSFIGNMSHEQRKTIIEAAGTSDLGQHAGISETSMIMHLQPQLVQMNAQDPKEGASLGRLDNIEKHGMFTGFNWYAKFHAHFSGDPTGSNAGLGKLIFDMATDNVAAAIKSIKEDNISPGLVKEYAQYGNNPYSTPGFY